MPELCSYSARLMRALKCCRPPHNHHTFSPIVHHGQGIKDQSFQNKAGSKAFQ